MDRETVKTGFELCANGEPCKGEKFLKCPFSPRNNAEQNCGVTMARNALELLEEQEPVDPKTDKMRNRICPKCNTVLRGRFCHECGQAVKWE